MGSKTEFGAALARLLKSQSNHRCSIAQIYAFPGESNEALKIARSSLCAEERFPLTRQGGAAP
jgi:hypothetical protein